ncbi:MAG: T9SS type B sorting domain-containing protein [Bacteroidota bacterium]
MQFKKVSLFVLIYFWLVAEAICQVTDCSNIGFENGNMNGWKLTTGTLRLANAKVLYENETEGIFENGVQLFNNSDGNDPKIYSQNIPTVSSGSRYSVRLGNVDHGGRFDRIQTTFIPDAVRTIFLYKFAVLLQDFANHATYQKPGFNIQVLDENGKSVACSEFNVQLNSTGAGALKGFQIQGDTQYLNWTTGAIDLKPYVGRKLTIIVTAHGCTNQRHFGYAYFDAECVKAEIKQLSKCPDQDGNILLKAPDGFGNYNWENGQSSQIAKVNAIAGANNRVKMLPLYSLENTCELGLDHTINYAKTDTTLNYNICENDAIIIDNQRFESTGTFIKNINRFNVCDSTITLNLIVTKKGRHSFSTKICEGESVKVGDSTYVKTGNYTTIINRKSQCDSIVVTNILVDKKLDVEANFDYKTITIGDSLELATNLNPADNNSFLWRPSLNTFCANCPITWVKPITSGYYTINVTNPNRTCFDADTLYIKVEPCQIHAPDVFTPNNDGENGKFYLFGGQCIRQIKSIAIYNRWGELMYQKENFPPSDASFGWDGTYLGQPLPSDVYPFKVKYELREGKMMDLTHAVTLIR